MLKLSLFDYNDAYVLVAGTVMVTVGPPDAGDANKRAVKKDKGLIFTKCAQLTDCINEINNT